ncbi:unnamed protein product [Adineta ricciae]|uniref:EF-hand domain-containing protein n=1 Tax=Adineta ricciae TaxID=249248 RepID=A0A814PG80_ADIRI|nr:unnamed protein product [Adineta ricciae]CAF1352586.1 unnamed protein product [Adineta ricciae]
MINLFRSRLPPQLMPSQITRLSEQSKLSFEEVQEWHDRFLLCYPYGYVSFEEFHIYLKRLHIYNGNYSYQHEQIPKRIVKQLFYKFKTSGSRRLNFEEFFRCNMLIAEESNEIKLTFLLKLFDQEKKYYYYSRKDIHQIFTTMFHLFNISPSNDDLLQRIDTILTRLHLHDSNVKICWNTFCVSILNQSSLFELLISSPDEDSCEIFITHL